MAHRSTLDISLTPEWEEFITTRVASGRYQSASEVVREGLRLLDAREKERQEALSAVREKIAIGLEQAKRGEFRDGEEVFAALEERLLEAERNE